MPIKLFDLHGYSVGICQVERLVRVWRVKMIGLKITEKKDLKVCQKRAFKSIKNDYVTTTKTLQKDLEVIRKLGDYIRY